MLAGDTWQHECSMHGGHRGQAQLSVQVRVYLNGPGVETGIFSFPSVEARVRFEVDPSGELRTALGTHHGLLCGLCG